MSTNVDSADVPSLGIGSSPETVIEYDPSMPPHYPTPIWGVYGNGFISIHFPEMIARLQKDSFGRSQFGRYCGVFERYRIARLRNQLDKDGFLINKKRKRNKRNKKSSNMDNNSAICPLELGGGETVHGQEPLLLSLEEAMFLVMNRRLGVICGQSGKQMSVNELWNACRRHQSGFILSFVVYYYFNSRGWIPRSGTQLGADFVLYRHGGPSVTHADVVVMIIDDNNKPDWLSIIRVARVANSVKKTLVCAVVQYPMTIVQSSTDNTMCSEELNIMNEVDNESAKVVKLDSSSDPRLNDPIQCLEIFIVKECYLRRWIPEGDREANEEDKMEESKEIALMEPL